MNKTFKNKNYKKRDYESTNKIACTAVEAPNENWIECDKDIIEDMNLTQLYMENSVRYYGYL